MTEKRKRNPVWTDLEDAKLLHARDVLRVPWDKIEQHMPGRSRGGCVRRYYTDLQADNQATRRNWKAKGRRVAVPPKPVVPGIVRALVEVFAPPIAPAPPKPVIVLDRGGSAPLGGLRDYAELLARIAERGLTGGVLGDPPPGRSALDQRRSGGGVDGAG
ncbi:MULTISPECIES: SANT/Myb-like DNA-binding domain-containing protein [unclassified Bradyrhizobium]|uniref:SANT/Myb-like DNA-binding domain-containing protein n=1 Tax=unclassified Bradyrhizobium TaxID=2631580 RepID=UPI001BABB1BC|nr:MULTISPECIES: SANT/Myb-like DNA-binding domain-containing protein [unclassified Bradyrhizobium]WLA52356.1 SANT/Myb-like DNA-binding domain-containing protein [Bradyrhizobium elkanii]MBR1206978.1 SANT/Myb domain-containing protein [Bradyrhizobium sp. AUGA SZCCT0124]MBR1313517.1 SANT/Myb domain-containing protein [Bradyrhizobium sp. AUGA SZCCT0051]MBR1343386.1 SANT/Myb domain-containing protein [Bradyrhizobium sp. AUGA SZCCT0105]MBR1357194.1 SANT/Myb domain-containing protein [Bradyrhizobium 